MLVPASRSASEGGGHRLNGSNGREAEVIGRERKGGLLNEGRRDRSSNRWLGREPAFYAANSNRPASPFAALTPSLRVGRLKPRAIQKSPGAHINCFLKNSISAIILLVPPDPPRSPLMSDAHAAPSKRLRQREATRGRRLATAERRRTMFDLVVSGHSYEAIARETGLIPSALRREVGKAIAARPVEAPDRYVHLQAARIEKALLALDAAVERGDVQAVSQYLKVVAALDRYHGLAFALAPPAPAAAPAPERLPAPAAPLAPISPRRSKPTERTSRRSPTARKMAPSALKRL
jgi:hypothetical protein